MNNWLFQFIESPFFHVACLIVQIFALVGIAQCVARLFRNAKQKHFVWLSCLLAAIVLLPLQSIVPPLALQFERPNHPRSGVTSELPTAELAASKSYGEQLDVPELVPITPKHSDSSRANVNHQGQLPIEFPVTTIDPVSSTTSQAGGYALWRTSYFGVLMLIYAAGIIWVLLQIITGSIRFRLVKADVEIESKTLEQIQKLARNVGLTTCPQVIATARVQTPLVGGMIFPRILVPTDFDGWHSQQRSIAMLHELCHIKRFDLVFEFLARVAKAIYWFHPALYFASRELQRTREIATDEAVVELGITNSDYARALLAIASQNASGNSMGISIPMSGEQDLTNRIRSVLNCQANDTEFLATTKRTLVASSFLILVGLSLQLDSVAKPVADATQPPFFEETTLESKQERADSKFENSANEENTSDDDFFACIARSEIRKPWNRNGDYVDIAQAEGVVRDSSGKPIANALVVFRDGGAYSSSRGRKINCVIAKTKTDENGKYKFQNLRFNRRYFRPEMVAATESGQLGWHRIVFTRGHQPSSVVADIQLQESVPYRGQLVTKQGAPISSAQLSVAILREKSPLQHGSISTVNFNDRAISPQVETDQDGRFEFPSLCRSQIIALSIEHPDLPNSWIWICDDQRLISEAKSWGRFKTDTYANNSVIEMDTGTVVAGQVVDWNGEPVAGVVVDLFRQQDISEADGSFAIRVSSGMFDLDRSDFELSVSGDANVPRSKWSFSKEELRAGNLTLRIERPASLVGQVLAR